MAENNLASKSENRYVSVGEWVEDIATREVLLILSHLHPAQ